MPMTVGLILAKQKAKDGSEKFASRWGPALIPLTFVTGQQPNLSRAEKLPYVYSHSSVFVCLLFAMAAFFIRLMLPRVRTFETLEIAMVSEGIKREVKAWVSSVQPWHHFRNKEHFVEELEQQ